MLRVPFRLLVLGMALGCASCLSAVKVHRAPISGPSNTPAAPRERVEGLPFYVKRAVCLQETAYLERLLQVTLEIRLGKDILFAETKLAPDHAYLSLLGHVEQAGMTKAELDGLKRVIQAFNSEASSNRVDSLATLFQSLTTSSAARPIDNAALALGANATKQHVYVDYSTQYFVNATRPWIGSASVSADFAADGTLAKQATTIEDKTVETMLTAIPGLVPLLSSGSAQVSDVADSLAQMAFFGQTAAPPNQAGLRASLTIQPIEILHTFSKQRGDQSPCLQVYPPIDARDSDAAYRRQVLLPKPAGDSSTPKKDETVPDKKDGDPAKSSGTASEYV